MAAVGTFSSFCKNMNKIARIERDPSLKSAQIHTLLQSTLSAPNLQKTSKLEVLQAIFSLLIPTANLKLHNYCVLCVY